MPKVSVIIPAYNAENYIDATLSSISSQTLMDFEVLVVDDGSSDSTKEIVARHCAADERFHLLEQPNLYAGVARNNGIDHARGEYLYFLDADDYIDDSALATLLESAENYGADIVVARSEGFDAQTGARSIILGALNGVPFDCYIPQASYAGTLFSSFIGWPWDKLYKKDFIEKAGLRFQGLRTTNDAYFVFGALALANGIVCIDEVLFHHRTNNPQSLEGTRSKSWDNAIVAIRAIGELLNSSEQGRLCLNSYANWVLDYTFWTIGSLTSDEAEAYLTAVEAIIQELPADNAVYTGILERELRSNACMNRAKSMYGLLAVIQRLDGENQQTRHLVESQKAQIEDLQRLLDEANENVKSVYRSHSYRAGNAVMRPLGVLKRLVTKQ